METGKVSVIVPVYNGEKYILRCLNSLIKQTYENVEIIVVNDGSTDMSGRICHEFADKHERVKIFHLQNSGVSAARNKGIEEASGEYLTFVDADDYVKPDMIACLVKILKETESDVAGCGYFIFKECIGEDTDTDRGTDTSPDSKREIFTGREFIEMGILASDTRCWSKLYTREIIGHTRYDSDLTIGEDMLFLLDIVCKQMRICRTEYKGYGYFANETGAMAQQFKKSYMDQITCWQRADEKIAQINPLLKPKVVSILMISTMLVVGKLAVLAGDKRKAYNRNIRYCSELIKGYRKEKGAFKGLSKGYQLKVMVFCRIPNGYLKGYHWWMQRKNQAEWRFI